MLVRMRSYAEVRTPAALVDLDRLEANLERMQRYVDGHDIRLRPHIKTHKARWLAERQVGGGAVGVTVATPIEARRVGPAAPEVLVAYPAFAARSKMVAEVAAERPTLIAVDSVGAVRSLQQALAKSGTTDPVGLLIEVDVGMRRCGVQEVSEALTIARSCGDGVVYRGLMFYPGHIRDPVPDQDQKLERLARDLNGFVQGLGDAGLAPEIVSGGSTPTAFRSHEVPHQTEIRPGTYVFNDRTTAAIGACDWDDCAYTILATVVSTAVPGQAVVDAGSKALSSDPLRADGYGGFGQLLDRPGVVVRRMSEEHGILDLGETDWRPAVGDRVRIIPNHVCVSVNLQPRVYGVREEAVEREWAVEAVGWW